MIWIGYTTRYREGGPKFQRAACTLEREKRAARPGSEVRCERIESKREFVDAMERVEKSGALLDELHLIGHGGMYGPMFRTQAMPEQFSPHEWRSLRLPFSRGASAYFHACRSARWFAPFFARTFGVTTYGYHWYTTLSSRPDRFRWDAPFASREAPLYVVACPGRKSHGPAASLLKFAGFAPIERMKRFEPREPEVDSSYDRVAALYDAAFTDIKVRREEWRWLEQHLAPLAAKRVLDIGCGNGSLLLELAPDLVHGTGVDRSPSMIERARARARERGLSHKLAFEAIDGPRLPFADACFDAVIALLSFRYLDWDPILNELRRVLVPKGHILIVDMVTVPLGLRELPRFVRDKLRQLALHAERPEYRRALKRLVRDPRWATLLKYNPIRAEHELRWFLESRFPGRRVELLTLGYDTRVVGFDSGPLEPGWLPPNSYP